MVSLEPDWETFLIPSSDIETPSKTEPNGLTKRPKKPVPTPRKTPVGPFFRSI